MTETTDNNEFTNARIEFDDLDSRMIHVSKSVFEGVRECHIEADSKYGIAAEIIDGALKILFLVFMKNPKLVFEICKDNTSDDNSFCLAKSILCGLSMTYTGKAKVEIHGEN